MNRKQSQSSHSAHVDVDRRPLIGGGGAKHGTTTAAATGCTTNIQGDRANIAILFFLYLLQGIPLGLSSAIPMLLQNRGASYKEQAEFSFAYWPFSLKLLWAPIVDSLYSKRFGRRKTWLIPTQYLIGVFMLLLSTRVDEWLGGGAGDGLSQEQAGPPNVAFITAIFFALNFLAATQDIAVDGWALTMLKPRNVGHASTCNSVGQTAGYFLGYVLFIALESADFCNSYVRGEPSKEGFVTLPGFLCFWGVVFLVTTTLVALLKREKSEHATDDDENDAHSNGNGDGALRKRSLQPTPVDENLNIRDSYLLLFKIMKMPAIRTLCAILLTVKVSLLFFRIECVVFVRTKFHVMSDERLSTLFSKVSICESLRISWGCYANSAQCPRM